MQHICITIWLQLAGVHMQAQALVQTIMARKLPPYQRGSSEQLRIARGLLPARQRSYQGSPVKVLANGTCSSSDAHKPERKALCSSGGCQGASEGLPLRGRCRSALRPPGPAATFPGGKEQSVRDDSSCVPLAREVCKMQGKRHSHD